MPLRNILTLLLCQLISATGAIILVTLGGIIGAKLTDNPALATLPISIMVICIAATTVPATVLMGRIGRKAGFALASLCSVISILLALYALDASSFAAFIAASGMFGINMAFTQQYRYAAVESVDPQYAPRAISLVLLGAIGGALVGPELIRYGQFIFPSIQYAGTLGALALMYLLQIALLLSLRPMREEESEHHLNTRRPLRKIVRQPVYMVAVLGGVTAYGVMTLIMTATPLSMHINDGFSIEETASIIRSHVLGMYVPSLFSGFLIERFGTVRLMTAGGIALLAASMIAMQGHTFAHYWYALVLLGIGWNFLYVGGTTMLTLTYSMNERFRAQAVNEFTVFGTSATASLLAGTVIHLYGWQTLVLLPLPLLLLTIVSLFLVRRDPLVKRLAPRAA
ncbi:MAG: MFS transporter [Woeseiaceae bacterium]|nr:MFS transporter [Woeseiaceae bacterium]